MRLFQKILILLAAFALFSCAENRAAKTPLETLKAYTQAIKKNDAREMKALLSKGSLEMAEKEAKAQGISADEVIKRETLFAQDQKTVEFRNEKTEGEQATIEMKNSYGTWDKVYFVKEDGNWKIAKERAAEELIKEIEEENKRSDEQMNQSRQP